MRATILFFALTVLVAVSDVWWVNSRSPIEEDLTTHEVIVSEPAFVPRAVETSASRQKAWQEAIDEQRGLRSPRSAALGRQLAAERARSDYGLKGCFDTGEKCRCIGADNQRARVSVDVCRIVASEPQLLQQ
jgi:hypothetical protein